MASTQGMTEDYDEHSEYQQRVAANGASLVADAVDALDLPTPPEPLVLVDLGSATGRTAVGTMAGAVATARARRADLGIACVYSDLVTNDWDALFSNVAADPSLGAEPGDDGPPPVLAMASAGSFFDATVPAGLAHLQTSFSAAHWLRQQPTAAVPDGMYPCEATGSARTAIADQAADDWQRFVRARSVDLRPGGRLVVQCVGTAVDDDGRELVTARELLDAMWHVAVGMADDGLILAEAVERYVFPVYPRTIEEARVPFEDSTCELELVEVSVDPVANPYLEAWHRSGDTEAYARDYAAFVRGFAASALTEGLFGGADELVDTFFTRLEDRFRQRPEQDAFRDWTLTVVARRR